MINKTIEKSKQEKIRDQLEDDKIQLALNSRLEPIAVFPEDSFQREALVDDQRFRDHVNSLWYEKFDNQFPTNTELNQTLSLIRGECWKGGRIYTEVEAIKTEEDPILQTMLEFMNKNESYDDLTTNLHNELRDLEKSRPFATAVSMTSFCNIFSRRLGRLIPALRGLGVEVVIRHEENGSHVSIKRTELFQCEPVKSELEKESADD